MPNCPKCDKPVYFVFDAVAVKNCTLCELCRGQRSFHTFTAPKAEFAEMKSERKTSLGKDWHGSCLRCEKCNKTLTPGGHAEHEGKPYCNHPCYSALFGPGGFGRGGAESYVYNK